VVPCFENDNGPLGEEASVVGELSNTFSKGDVGPVGAVGNVISVSIRATMSHEKQEINERQQL
jgi:hypothetical protein